MYCPYCGVDGAKETGHNATTAHLQCLSCDQTFSVRNASVWFQSDVYRGWNIWYDHNAPVTSKCRAVQHGVYMNNSTLVGLKRMIDQRVADAQARNNQE